MLEAVLLTVTVLSVSDVMPKKWEIRENSSISKINENGSMSMVKLKYFAIKGQDSVTRKAKSNKQIGDLYITSLNENISEQYVRENGFTNKTEIKKLSSSANDFCYEISGAENGAVWEVWVTFEQTGTPNVTVIKNGGEAK